MTPIGTQLREHRKSYGMSQAELSRRIKISQTSLNLIEHDKTHDPHWSIVCRIAHVLGISLDGLAEDGIHVEP